MELRFGVETHLAKTEKQRHSLEASIEFRGFDIPRPNSKVHLSMKWVK